MNDLLFNTITIDKIPPGIFGTYQPAIDVLRLDKIDPLISGNKWFKLQYFLDEALALKKNHIISFGGAWSNHILATAACCKRMGLHSTGIIRGEQPAELSSTLKNAVDLGMELVFINREDYREKYVPTHLNPDDCYIIPEGGYGEKGATGAAHILDHCDKDEYSHVACAAGTGTMLAGLINASDYQEIIGISVLKNNYSLETDVRALVTGEKKNFRVLHDDHCGGYAKHSDELITFMNDLYERTGIPTDFVYTGKLFFAIARMFLEKILPAGVKLLVIHSGGLQGNDSLKKGTLIF